MGSLIWYKFQFVIELIVIEAMFAFKLRPRKNFGWRLAICLATIFAIVAVFPVKYNALHGSVMFLFFFILTVGGFIVCFRESVWNILFCSIAAYTIQHIAYLTYTIIVNLFTSIDGNHIYHDSAVAFDVTTTIIATIVYLACYLMVYAEARFLLLPMIPKNSNLQLCSADMILASTLVILVDIVFNMITVYNAAADKLSVFLEQIYNLIICFLVLQMLFQKLNKKKILEEYDVINQILQQERQQFQYLKNNINIINVKVHDLKHQLHSLRHSSQPDLEELKSIEKTFAIYQTIAKTGNETLDLILTDKLLHCEQKEIELVCFADGKSISFMREEDIYSLFGNALDNAIAAVEQLPPEKREIKFHIQNLGDYVKIRVENEYTGVIRMEDGRPITTKKNTYYHGYGVLSIQMIAEKYNGKLNISVKDNKFVLDIFFNRENE